MPDLTDPHIAAQLVPLQGPAFAPGGTARAGQMEAEQRWLELLDAGLIGTVQPLSPEILASIDAAEQALGVGKYRGR